MRLILENDDFGLTYGFSKAINILLKSGVTTATCVKVNSYAYEKSLKLLKKYAVKKSIGVHVDLTQGPFLTGKIIHFQGYWGLNYLEYLFKLLFPSKKLLVKIKLEIEAQVVKAEKDGLYLDHLNSHDHIHMIPKIFKIFCEVCQKHKIGYLRLVREPFYLAGRFKTNFKAALYGNFLKLLLLNSFAKINIKTLRAYNIKTTDVFYGLAFSNYMDNKILTTAVLNAIAHQTGSVEIAMHPAFINFPKDKNFTQDKFLRWFSNLPQRESEFKTLKSNKIRKILNKNKIDLVSYKNL